MRLFTVVDFESQGEVRLLNELDHVCSVSLQDLPAAPVRCQEPWTAGHVGCSEPHNHRDWVGLASCREWHLG